MQFNNRIGQTNKKLETAAKKFYKAIEPLASGRQADPSLSSAYAEVGAALKEAHKNFENVLPPHGSRTGAELMDRYRTFLSQQQTIYDKCITPIYNAAQDQRLEPRERWRTIQPLLSRASYEESLAATEFRKAHTEFCKAHMLEPK